jgi:hypothetical protein
MAEAIQDAEDAGLDVVHRYERRPPPVDRNGDPIPGATGAIIQFSTISHAGHTMRDDEESGGWGSMEEFLEEHGSVVAGHTNVMAAHAERKVVAETLRDAVAAAPVKTPRPGRQ